PGLNRLRMDMRYLVVATDYDGTLATNGLVSPEAVHALERLRTSGRRLILVTGRELRDLLRIFGPVDLFEYIVAENGAVLYRPAGRDTKVLAKRPPHQLVRALREKGVEPLSVGEVVVASSSSNASAVLEVIQALGLELQPIFNKDSLMVLPPGVDKATGLAAALAGMGVSPLNVVGIGDAENDQALLSFCGLGVAVANAVPLLRERADLVTQAADGAGVVELVARLVATDLADLARHT
ncbi:MAG TPA: HAD family hydrolase, partial [Candidatus Limnocylindria bacterium]|nr:HAD family hydrolase [Candidatus Limnocylindria bacterium]